MAVTNDFDDILALSDREFEQFRRYIYDHAGISLGEQKKPLVASRLLERVKAQGLRSYGDYFNLVNSQGQESELQQMVDLLTTHETYFFREPAHFNYLREHLLPAFVGRPFRALSAACSSGEEVYSLAMECAETLGNGDWEVVGSDISQGVLAQARAALYPMERARGIPREMLVKYCLKGIRSQEGQLLIDPKLARRARFIYANLKVGLPDQTQYDLIFLRNVLIYFDNHTKADVVGRLVASLRPGGYLFTSHVETLHGVTADLKMIRPSIYRRPPRPGA